MNAQPTFEFQWLSPLGIAVIIFLLEGILFNLIGGLALLLLNRNVGPSLLIVSNRTDSIVFGRSPEDLLRDDPALFKLRTILLHIMSGLLFALGCFHVAVVWFGLRQGQPWALAVLAIVGFAVLPFWWVALRPYLVREVALTLGDVPPFMWIPALLLLPAVFLGWIGLT